MFGFYAQHCCEQNKYVPAHIFVCITYKNSIVIDKKKNNL